MMKRRKEKKKKRKKALAWYNGLRDMIWKKMKMSKASIRNIIDIYSEEMKKKW